MKLIFQTLILIFTSIQLHAEESYFPEKFDINLNGYAINDYGSGLHLDLIGNKLNPLGGFVEYSLSNRSKIGKSNTIFMWVRKQVVVRGRETGESDLQERNTMIVRMYDNNDDGKIDTVVINNWYNRNREKGINPHLIITNFSGPSLCVHPVIHEDVYIDDFTPPEIPNCQNSDQSNIYQELQSVFSAYQILHNNFVEMDSGGFKHNNANVALHAEREIQKACLQPTPRKMYFSLTSTFSNITDKAYKILNKRYPSISTNIEAISYMKLVCAQRARNPKYSVPLLINNSLKLLKEEL